MSVMQWSDDLSVGIRKMDEQHKQLIGLVNALYSQKGTHKKDFVEKILATLVLYTRIHFVDEERILKKLAYPYFDKHHEQHVQFIKAVDRFRTELQRSGPTPELIDKLSLFLSNWLKQHIQVEDRAYGAYLEN